MTVAPDSGAKDSPQTDPSVMDGSRGTVTTETNDGSMAGMTSCGKTETDPKNCGMCGRDCSALPHVRAGGTVSCVAGRCVVPATSCDEGYSHCTANDGDICETALGRPEACGACGKACSASMSLCAKTSDGKYTCVGKCAAPTADQCGASCTDTKTDVANCGTCGNDCRALPNAATTACVAGECKVVKCRDGFGDCTAASGCETSLSSSGSNCGQCGKSCAVANGTSTCQQNACSAPTCSAGFDNCDKTSPDCETPVNASADCGGCGVKCGGAAPVCALANGKYSCVSDCGAAAPDKCGSSCVNLKTDASHCGACPTSCSFSNAAAACVNGACQMGKCNPGFDDCNKNSKDGCETPLDTNSNCGSCTTACSFANAKSSCVSEKCTAPVCNDGFGNCDTSSPDCETSLGIAQHCGRCDVSCSGATPMCSTATGSGMCSSGCSASTPTRCGSDCVDIKTNVAHCGGCNKACVGTCSGGICVATWDVSVWDGTVGWAP